MALPPKKRRKEQVEERRRYRVAILARRRRLIDPDNLVAKFIIDGCRYAGIIPDDDSRTISEFTIRQEKVAKGESPETLITIEEVRE